MSLQSVADSGGVREIEEKNRGREKGGKKRAGATKLKVWSPLIRQQFSFLTIFPKEKKSDYLIGGIKFSQAPRRLKPTSLKLPANKHQTRGSINEADVLISHLWEAKQLTASPRPVPPCSLSFSDSTINDL